MCVADAILHVYHSVRRGVYRCWDLLLWLRKALLDTDYNFTDQWRRVDWHSDVAATLKRKSACTISDEFPEGFLGEFQEVRFTADAERFSAGRVGVDSRALEDAPKRPKKKASLAQTQAHTGKQGSASLWMARRRHLGQSRCCPVNVRKGREPTTKRTPLETTMTRTVRTTLQGGPTKERIVSMAGQTKKRDRVPQAARRMASRQSLRRWHNFGVGHHLLAQTQGDVSARSCLRLHAQTSIFDTGPRGGDVRRKTNRAFPLQAWPGSQSMKRLSFPSAGEPKSTRA